MSSQSLDWAVFGPYLLVFTLAVAWALAEILQTFRGDVGRALRTGWTALFVLVNAAFAMLVYALVQLVVPQTSDPWLVAFAAGIGWQALIRTRINLIQPLNAETGEAVSLSLSDLYGRFQQFCREQIDQTLAVERIRLLDDASKLPIPDLEHQLRLLAHASILRSSEDERAEKYIEKLQKYPDEQRALSLASFLLRIGGYELFNKRLKEMKKKEKEEKSDR